LSLANVLSVGAMRAVQARGLRIGRDLSFAGFDEFPGAEFSHPPVTVIAQPIAAMAAACLRMATHDKPRVDEKTALNGQLKWRGSVC
jgi:DNA-binding LacI/PurR family transcriptional regulator